MQTVHLEIEDNKLDTFLTILSNFKGDLVKSFTVSSDEKLDDAISKYLKTKQFQKDKAYFQTCLDDIESGKSELISHDIVWEQIDNKIQYKNAN